MTRGSQPRTTTDPAAIRRDHAQPEETSRNGATALLSVCRGFFVIRSQRHLERRASGRGALGVTLLGSLLGSGRALSLHIPLAAAASGYLVALALAWITIRGRS